jgi:hypothetical protein
VLVKTEAACPSCGSKKLREARGNDPVLLYTADETKCSMIRTAFNEYGIPHEERMCGPGAPPSILYGKMPNALYHIFVPFGEVEHCKDILRGIGALGENDGEQDTTEMEPISNSASGGARLIFFRIMAGLLFLGLIYAVVNLTDAFVDFLKSAFH